MTQPISKHYTIRIYDDIVTKGSTTGPDMIKKTDEAFDLSHDLGTDGGRLRVVGTHYHFNDQYAKMKKQGEYHVNVHPATHNGKKDGRPVFLSQSRLDDLRRKKGAYIFSCQQLLDPVEDNAQGFARSWIRYYDQLPSMMNTYLLVDPANEKKKESDYTTMGVVGLDGYGNYFLVDLLRDKLNLTERKTALFAMFRAHPGLQRVGYESYGIQADIQYIQEEQKREGLYFEITPLGGKVSKQDRIRWLVPLFENGRFFLPKVHWYKGEDLVQVLVDDELLLFPFAATDDIIDMMARIRDEQLGAVPPDLQAYAALEKVREDQIRRNHVDGV